MIKQGAVGLIFTLAFFVLYYTSLLVELILGYRAEQVAHAI